MADIELVIKISNYDKEWITNGYCIPEEINTRIAESIAKGTPLPKGHGRLIDADEYRNDILTIIEPDLDRILDYLADAPTIIEADKEYEVEVITRGNCMMCGKELTEGLFFCKECEDKANKTESGDKNESIYKQSR